MFEYDTLPADYGNPHDPAPSTMASPTPGQMPGYGAATSGATVIPVWVGSGGWSYQMAADGTITVLSEPSGRYKGLKRTAADGRAYDAIVAEGTKYFSKQPIILAAIASAAATSRAKNATQYAAALRPSAPSTPTFAPLPGTPALPAAPAATPAGAFYEQWWFPPVVALGVLGVVGAGIWYTSGKRK